MSRTRHRERARDSAPGTPGCGLGSPRNGPECDRRVHGWPTRHAAREAILGCMALRAARILGHPWPASTHAHQPTSLSRHPRDDVRCAFACCWIDAVSDACARRKARCVVIRSSSSGCVASLTATKLHHRCRASTESTKRWLSKCTSRCLHYSPSSSMSTCNTPGQSE